MVFIVHIRIKCGSFHVDDMKFAKDGLFEHLIYIHELACTALPFSPSCDNIGRSYGTGPFVSTTITLEM